MYFSKTIMATVVAVLTLGTSITSASDLGSMLLVTAKPMTEVDPSAQADTVELALTSQTDKEINALSIQVQASGNSSMVIVGNLTEELVFTYLTKKYSAPITDKYVIQSPIRLGETIYIRGGFGEPASALTFTVRGLIFGDNTAVGDPDFIANTFAARKGYEAELHLWIPRLQEGGSDLRKNLLAWDKELVPGAPTSAEESGRTNARQTLKSEFSKHEYMKDKDQQDFYAAIMPYYIELDTVLEAHMTQAKGAQ